VAKTSKTNFNNFWQVFKLVQIYLWAIILFVLLFFIGVNEGLLGEMPDLEAIQNPHTAVSTSVWSADGEVLGTFYNENRIEVSYGELSPYLVNGLVATEDKRFYEHSGIDIKGLIRVIIKTGLLGQDAGGGSTITQQLAKNLFHQKAFKSGKFRRMFQKIKEWILAAKIERNFTKDEIINLYFNTIGFGYNSYGIKTAAFTYFYKKPADLNLSESATLVAMLNGPSLFNPRVREELTRERRNLVLKRMLEMNFIAQREYDAVVSKPIKLNFHNPDFREGVATYFRMIVREEIKAWCKKNRKADGSAYDIYKDGLNIYTTIDSRMQAYAEEAMKEHMSYLQKTFFTEWHGREPWTVGARAKPNLLEKIMKETPYYQQLKSEGKTEKQILNMFNKKHEMTIYDYRGNNGEYNIDTVMSSMDSLRYYLQMLQCGFLAVDATNGDVKAWIGGPHMQYFQLDHAKKSTKRQVGSTMKPLQYAVAIERGYKPCQPIVYTAPSCGQGGWDPKGTDNWEENAIVPMQYGLWYSDNRITANLMCDFGPDALVDMAKRLSIDSYLEAVPSLCLGVSDISLFEMVGAYTAFANLGTHSQPIFIKKITDKKGNVLASYRNRVNEALPENVAYITTEMLKGAVNKGTATRLRSRYGLSSEAIAGKTGTTQNNADAWFIGYTPQLVVGCWVGFDQPSVHFATSSTGQGSVAALPIVGSFLRKSYNNSRLGLNSNMPFPYPSDSTFLISFSCDTPESADTTIRKTTQP
jgi:penicillin-binding protein 1A